MCTANGSDAVAAAARAHVSDAHCRLLRGGCYGLCEIGPNVVVRRFEEPQRGAGENAVDRLTLTHADNETVYSRTGKREILVILDAHLERDESVPTLTRDSVEKFEPPKTDVAARIRALREKRRASQEGGPE
jgi:(2Fe-2S) ferredoxin